MLVAAQTLNWHLCFSSARVIHDHLLDHISAFLSLASLPRPPCLQLSFAPYLQSIKSDPEHVGSFTPEYFSDCFIKV